MKKFLKSCLSLFVFNLLLIATGHSQATGYTFEVDTVHYGMVGAYDLNGYVTYDLFVNLTNETDYVSAVYGLSDDDPVSDPCNINAGFCDVIFGTDCDFFQHPLGGFTSASITCSLCEIDPALCYDSYLTIGEYCSSPCVLSALVCPSSASNAEQEWIDNNELHIEDGAIFTLPDQDCGVAGDDLQVLIGRFTTCGNINGCFCVEVWIEGDSDNVQNVQFCFNNANPCEANDIDPAITVLDTLNCFGECSQIQIGDGIGNGDITYELWNLAQDPDNPVATQVNDNIFCVDGNEDYFIAIVDEFSCRDTSEVVNYFEPPLLEIQSSIVSNELCAGENAGEITNSATGGVVPYVFSADQPGLEDILDGESWSGLACMSPTVTVTDDNGCTDQVMLTIDCPDTLALDLTTTTITCYGYDDGAFTAEVTGGTGIITATWTCDLVDTEISGPSPLDISVTDLGPCDYQLVVQDANGCQILGLFTIDEPAEFLTTVIVDDASCNGICDGDITIIPTGGTPDITTECTDLSGGAITLGALCPGDYICVTTDGAGCQITDSVTVVQPPDFEFTDTVTDVTCAGGEDGTIIFENITGGVGELDIEIVGGPVGVETPDPIVGFAMLPADSYTINFIDLGNGCVYSQGPFVIIEPEPVSAILTVTDITCFGANDGIVDISCAGGTGAIVISGGPLADTIACPGTITDLLPGAGEITLTDDQGCSILESFNIDEPELLTLVVTDTTHIVCGGDNSGGVEYDIAGGVGDYTMQLDGVEVTIFDLVQLFAGDYELCVLDENFCTACDSMTVLENDPLQIIANELNNASCTGMTNGSASLFVTGGTGQLEVGFDPDDIDLNNLGEGPFTVFVSDSLGCAHEQIFNIGVDEVSDMIIEIFTTPVTCWNTNDGTATASVGGGNPPLQISWSDPLQQMTATAVGLQEGSYFVNITDDVGCTFDTIAVVQPNVGCFFIATALTPNGDGSNDEWLVGGMEFFPDATVSVINRWGQVIYESRGYTVPWDGTYNGQRVPVSDYYYMINFADERDPISGTVTVKY